MIPSDNIWSIPLDGILYLCWKDKYNEVQHIELTKDEELLYYYNPDKLINDLFH